MDAKRQNKNKTYIHTYQLRLQHKQNNCCFIDFYNCVIKNLFLAEVSKGNLMSAHSLARSGRLQFVTIIGRRETP